MADMDYEAQRLENVAQKQKILAELNLHSGAIGKPVSRDPNTASVTRKRKIVLESMPSRASARVRESGVRPSYNDDAGVRKYNYVDQSAASSKPPRKRGRQAAQPVENETRSLVPTKDAEDLRAGWSRWTASGSSPTRDLQGTFHFDQFPDFQPNKSPEEVMREGCFGGGYFRPLRSRKLGMVVQDDWEELPESWYRDLDVGRYLVSGAYDPEVNKYKVACGQSIEEWEAAGWISFEFDIRGWFQWYCRFFMGRRCADDERQISRWKKCVGETGRWRRMLLKKYMQMGVRECFDYGDDEDTPEVSPVMHQTCHHWAWEVRQHVLSELWGDGKVYS